MTLAAVRERSLTHLRDPALGLSATTAGRRRIGSRGGWGWDGEGATPVEAASLALWGARTCRRDPARMRVG